MPLSRRTPYPGLSSSASLRVRILHARLNRLEKKLKDFDVIPEEFDSSEEPAPRWVAKMQRHRRGVTQEDRSD